jgi:hypothetical protein
MRTFPGYLNAHIVQSNAFRHLSYRNDSSRYIKCFLRIYNKFYKDSEWLIYIYILVHHE